MRPIIPSKKQNKNGGKLFFLFALFLIIFFGANHSAFRAVSSWLNIGVVPFWNTAGLVADAFPPAGGVFRSKTELAKENEALKQRINALTVDLKGYDFSMQENLELKKLLFGKKESSVFAGILAHPGGHLPFDTFLLDIGSAAGIKNGDIALSGQNLALGKVVETYSHSSKIKGFSSTGERTDVFLGPENIPAQLTGLGGGAYMAELPRDLDIREGDAAILPGSDGFILAHVESKEENLADFFQKLYLRSPVNIFELKYVQIIPYLSVNE